MLEISKCFHAKVIGRSDLALSGVWTHEVTLDLDFRGVVCVNLTKQFSGCRTSDKKVDKIGQIIFEKNEIVKLLMFSSWLTNSTDDEFQRLAEVLKVLVLQVNKKRWI